MGTTMTTPSSSPRPQTDMTEPVELLPERRVSPPTEDALARIGINQDRLAKSHDEFLAQLQKEIEDQKLLTAQQHEEITARLDRHSEDIANHDACLTRAIDAFEERMRKESAARLTSEHRAVLRQKEFLDGLAQWASSMGTFQMAVSGLQEAVAAIQGRVVELAVHHEQDIAKAAAALDQHGKSESWWIKNVPKAIGFTAVVSALGALALANYDKLTQILAILKP